MREGGPSSPRAARLFGWLAVVTAAGACAGREPQGGRREEQGQHCFRSRFGNLWDKDPPDEETAGDRRVNVHRQNSRAEGAQARLSQSVMAISGPVPCRYVHDHVRRLGDVAVVHSRHILPKYVVATRCALCS